MKGQVKFSPTELALIKDVVAKIAPTAPKHVPQETEIKPEQYIREAMSNNMNSFTKLQAKAEEYALLVSEKNREFFNAVEKKV